MTWADRLDAIESECSADGWNSYGATAVTPEAIRTARALCDSLDVVPTSRGGVQIGLSSESISFEVDAEGNVVDLCFNVEGIAEFLSADQPTETGELT